MIRHSTRAAACLLLLVNARWLSAAEPGGPDCCQGNPVCRLKQVKKDVKKTVYSEKCVPYCQSDCCCLDFIHRLCCPGFTCEPPRYKHVLLKKQITTGQKCEMQCVLEYEPCGPAPSASGPADVPPAPAAPPPAPPSRPRVPRSATSHPPDRL